MAGFVPTGIRTRVSALKGPRPRPLDDGDVWRNADKAFRSTGCNPALGGGQTILPHRYRASKNEEVKGLSTFTHRSNSTRSPRVSSTATINDDPSRVHATP